MGNLPLVLFLAALFAVHNNKNSMSLHEHERGKLSVTVDVGNLCLALFLVALFAAHNNNNHNSMSLHEHVILC